MSGLRRRRLPRLPTCLKAKLRLSSLCPQHLPKKGTQRSSVWPTSSGLAGCPKILGQLSDKCQKLVEFVHHVTRWASEVGEEIQDEVNPPARNVRPRLAEPDQEPQPAHVPHARGPPSEPDQLDDDIE